MPPGSWIGLRVDLPSEAADAVANFLLESGAPAVLTDDAAPAGRTALEASVPAGDEARVVAGLRRYLAAVAALAPTLGPATVSTAPVPDVDWDALAREHHRPVLIGHRLCVAPPWDVPDAPGRQILVIAPGMAFGTGGHATTRGCLEAIEAVVARRPVERALDVGTGSGILALALARLGVRRVVACDTDPAVLPIARGNLVRNRAPDVLLVGGGAEAVRGAFDLVAANLLADTLVAEAAALAARVAPGGCIVASGLLETQTPAVLAGWDGWRPVAAHVAEGWATLTLERMDS